MTNGEFIEELAKHPLDAPVAMCIDGSTYTTNLYIKIQKIWGNGTQNECVTIHHNPFISI